MIGGLLGALASASRTVLVDLINFSTIGAGTISPTDATARFRVNTNGTLEKRINGSWTVLSTWLITGVASDYDIKFTVTASAGAGLATGVETQQNLGATRTWTVVESTNGVAESSVNFTLEIFLAGESTPIDTITNRRLQANVEL